MKNLLIVALVVLGVVVPERRTRIVTAITARGGATWHTVWNGSQPVAPHRLYIISY